MMNIEKKKGGLITIHGGYMQTIGARGHVECYATHAWKLQPRPLHIYISMAYSLLHVSLFYFKNNPAWSWKSFMLKKKKLKCMSTLT